MDIPTESITRLPAAPVIIILILGRIRLRITAMGMAYPIMGHPDRLCGLRTTIILAPRFVRPPKDRPILIRALQAISGQTVLTSIFARPPLWANLNPDKWSGKQSQLFSQH